MGAPTKMMNVSFGSTFFCSRDPRVWTQFGNWRKWVSFSTLHVQPPQQKKMGRFWVALLYVQYKHKK